MNLTIRQLTTFREVFRRNSISQAAQVLGRTQPAVSAMISGLEDELGFMLFIRESGTLKPTPEAHYFIEEADAFLGRLEATKRTLRGIARLEKGKLRVACLPSATTCFMPQTLTSFVRDKRDLEVVFKMHSSAQIENLIASQQFDIGFLETPSPRKSIDQTDFDIECICALPADDPLAQREVLTPQDLDGAAMALLFPEHISHIQVRSVFAAAGCSYDWKFELQTFHSGCQFVEAGLCYMICDMITAHSQMHLGPAGIVFRPFRPRISAPISIITPAFSPLSLMASEFSRHLTAELERLQSDVAASMRIG